MATAKRGLTDPRVQGRPILLVPQEAADMLRISLDQLYHLTSAKKIPFLKVGGQLRFEPDRLIEELRVEASGERRPGPRSERVIRLEAGDFRFATPKRRQ